VATPVEAKAVTTPQSKKGALFNQLFGGLLSETEAGPAERVVTKVVEEVNPIVAEPVFDEDEWQPETKMVARKAEYLAHEPVEGDEKGPSSSYLDQLISEALSNNSELEAARQDEYIHLARAEYEKRNWFPEASGYLSQSDQPDPDDRDADDDGVNENGDPGRSWRRAYGVSASQLIFDWGTTHRMVRKEKYEAQSDAWNAKAKEVNTAYNVREAYWRMVLFNEVVNLRTRALNARKEERGAMADRVEANQSRRAELLAVEAEVALAEKRLLEAQNGLALSRENLLFYMGRDLDCAVPVKNGLSMGSVGSLITIDVEGHPEMKRLRSAQLAAHSGARAAKSGRLPIFYFQGTAENSRADGGSEDRAAAGNLVPDGANYQAGLFMSLPLGKQRVEANGKLAEARATQAQLVAQADALASGIRLKVSESKNKLQENVKGVEVAEKEKAAALENLSMMNELQEANNATRGDVAKARRDVAMATIGVWRAIYDVKEAEADLIREMGLVYY